MCKKDKGTSILEMSNVVSMHGYRGDPVLQTGKEMLTTLMHSKFKQTVIEIKKTVSCLSIFQKANRRESLLSGASWRSRIRRENSAQSQVTNHKAYFYHVRLNHAILCKHGKRRIIKEQYFNSTSVM